MEMCADPVRRGLHGENPVTTGNCNGNSPLVWDETMLGAMRAFCRRNQPVLCSPFVLGGANTPASVPATVAQLNAEALSALAYTQVIRRGCPAIYGHYLSTVSMKSGAPMAGTPEISLMNFMIGQMARIYGVPWRTSNTLGGAKTFDAQAGYESATTLMAVLHAGANYIWHSAGWNEAGMHCSVAKFVVDAEQCAMAYRMAEGIRNGTISTRRWPRAAMWGRGGTTLATRTRRKISRRAFFMPELFDNNSIEQWIAEGSKEITARALAHARGSCWPTTRNRSSTRPRTRRCATTSPGASGKFRRSRRSTRSTEGQGARPHSCRARHSFQRNVAFAPISLSGRGGRRLGRSAAPKCRGHVACNAPQASSAAPIPVSVPRVVPRPF
jgi:trimethylamine--corrinoid protein Co-methyltransferase